MSSRTSILEKIRNNKPELVELPDLSIFTHNVTTENLIDTFIEVSTTNASTVVNLVNTETSLELFLPKFIAENFGEHSKVYNTLNGNDIPKIDFKTTHVDVFVALPKIAVAENGCMWITNEQLPQRISAFGSENTLFVVDHKNIVPTMHQAYSKVKENIGEYGVFIAGPSKTADIEQSLVIGAQGAVSNTIVLI